MQLYDWFVLILLFFIIQKTNTSSKFCDAIDKSPNNLTNQNVLFVQLQDESLLKIESVLRNFFECYAIGMNIQNITIEQNPNTTTCEIVEPLGEKIQSSNLEWKIILSPFLLILDCSLENMIEQIEKVLPNSKIGTSFEFLGICESTEACDFMSNYTKYYKNRVIKKNKLAYENLELFIDEKNVSSKYIQQKYHYFNHFPRVVHLSRFWVTIFTLFALFFFTLLGFFICIYSLLSYALIEEDFQTRNDERENLARIINQQPQPEPFIFPEITDVTSQSEVIRTDQTQSTTRSPLNVETTQISELISGTTIVEEQ
ncbi:unnamed protein product [Caenorhabditis angaria]|uniref:Uncharacterized protein n=1 Tax=Caenorhabditis angaria TaxID=860376 RepID=A0A9P1IYU5_9PELO|nr:unnamed protein product [Caenorhabditis angaria]